jgi:hypothetical protein
VTPASAAELVDTLGEAFATGDVAAVLRCFAADGDVLYAGSEAGEVAVGVAALTARLIDLFARDERYSWRCRSVHVLACAAGVVVVAEADLTVRAAADGSPVEQGLPYRVSGLLEQAHGRWVWRMCQGAEPVSALPD